MKALALAAGAGAIAMLAMPLAVHAADAKRKAFGALPDGRTVEAVTLTNSKGVSATIISYGAALQS